MEHCKQFKVRENMFPVENAGKHTTGRKKKRKHLAEKSTVEHATGVNSWKKVHDGQ